MAEAIRDQNYVTNMLMESSSTPGLTLNVKGSELTGRLLVDSAAGSGTVTSVSVVSANGFAGTVATATTTPAITISTTINSPVLAGNGTAILAATTIGSGSTVVLQTSPTLITPVLGVATGTSLTLSNAGLALSATNSTDATPNQIALWKGTRATPTASDEIYESFNLNSSTGVSREFVRLRAVANTVTNTSEVGSFRIAIMSAGTLTNSYVFNPGSFTPSGNDGASLGTATTSFSDLFLASGAVVNFNNGNMTLTHAAGSLTFAGGNVLGLGAATATTLNGNTFTTGTYTLTGTAAKTLNFTNTLTLSGTDSTVMTFPTTSATIARTDAANTFTGVQTITNITLPDQGQVKLTVPTTDLKATGPTNGDFNSGYSSSAIGDLVYLDSSSTWQKCDANTLLLYNGLLGIALEVKASGNALLVALPGSFVYSTTGFPTFTIGGPIYMSETAGAVTQTAPTTTDAATRIVGWGVHADKMYFFPSPDYITHT